MLTLLPDGLPNHPAANDPARSAPFNILDNLGILFGQYWGRSLLEMDINNVIVMDTCGKGLDYESDSSSDSSIDVDQTANCKWFMAHTELPS